MLIVIEVTSCDSPTLVWVYGTLTLQGLNACNRIGNTQALGHTVAAKPA